MTLRTPSDIQRILPLPAGRKVGLSPPRDGRHVVVEFAGHTSGAAVSIDTGIAGGTLPDWGKFPTKNKEKSRKRRETRHRALSGASRTSALAPFDIRNYRYQWPSDLLTSWAFEVETLVLGWYIMVETGSVLLLTVLASLQYAGTLIAPIFGMIGDRMGHRDLLAAMRFAYTALSAITMTLALTGHLTPLNVMIIVAIMGMIRPSDLGVRGALLADIMPAGQLIAAISLSRTTQDSARIAGALSGAALFAALGIGFVYMAIVCLYLGAAALMLCLTRPAQSHGPLDHPSNGLRGGVGAQFCPGPGLLSYWSQT